MKKIQNTYIFGKKLGKRKEILTETKGCMDRYSCAEGATRRLNKQRGDSPLSNVVMRLAIGICKHEDHNRHRYIYRLIHDRTLYLSLSVCLSVCIAM